MMLFNNVRSKKNESCIRSKSLFKIRSRWLKYFTGERGTSRFTLYPNFPVGNIEMLVAHNNHHAELTVEFYLAQEQLLYYLHQ